MTFEPWEQETNRVIATQLVENIEKLLAGKNIWYKRPGSGINCNKLFEINGSKAKKKITKNKLINFSDFQK